MAAMLGVVDIDLNYKNLIVTTTLENIHLVPEL